VFYEQLRWNAQKAAEACQVAAEGFPGETRLKYQLARAYQVFEPRKAAALYEDLIAASYPAAFDNLGWLFVDGRVGRTDLNRAAALFRRGAELGDPDAMMSLAKFIKEGRTTPRSTNEDQAWILRAAAVGHREAVQEAQKIEEARRQQEIANEAIRGIGRAILDRWQRKPQ
jgi:TPR repeat protein